MSTIDEIEARLAQKAAEPAPESWKPETPGESIIGTVRRYEKGTTSWGDCVICVVESLRSPGRFASIWIFGAVLSNAFQKQQPRPGEVIRVEYGAEIQRDGQPSYRDWTLTVDRADGDGLTYAEAAGVAATTAPAPAEPQAFPTTGDVHGPAEAAAAAATAGDPVPDDIPF